MRCALLLLTAAALAAGEPGIRLERLWPQAVFVEPVCLVPQGTAWLVVERAGTIRRVAPDGGVSLFADLRAVVSAKQREEGLLALALHPDPADGRCFVWYTTPEPRRDVLAALRVAADGATADPATLAEILAIDDPYWNHNGGTLVFGPDRRLYLSTGDGGGGGDPLNAGQRLDTLLGKILRLDVDRGESGRPYAIPPDNPFVGRAGARGEIWAWGLRNVWRMSFDRATGELWAADVGQNTWEEVDLIVRGGNYGWNVKEGFVLFKGRKRPPPEGVTLIDPVVVYGRGLGISVTGGHVYRGSAIPALVGAYVYADFQSGRIFALRRREGAEPENRELLKASHLISTFGEGPDGELLLASFGEGTVWRIAPAR